MSNSGRKQLLGVASKRRRPRSPRRSVNKLLRSHPLNNLKHQNLASLLLKSDDERSPRRSTERAEESHQLNRLGSLLFPPRRSLAFSRTFARRRNGFAGYSGIR